MHDSGEGKDLRMGGQSQILMWNRESDDATLPELSPTGIALSVAPIADQWHCIEFSIDQQNGHLDTWIDGTAITGLTIDGTQTPDVDQRWLSQKPGWLPTLIDAKFGWESYGGSSNTLWYDDIAMSDSRIGCGE